ncbi:hypothetical protein SAMN05446935_8452 [Burkholderia sp. YR290]|nr:hypothetical protein SAMN05446935_8452 [Burkholderia sp. YR290]
MHPIALSGSRINASQCTSVLLYGYLSVVYVARHVEQFGSQMSGLLLPKASLEVGLRSCPVNDRFVWLPQPSRITMNLTNVLSASTVWAPIFFWRADAAVN